MEYFATSPSADKIGQVQHKIEENKNVMRENIDKILERGEKIELLVQKTDELGHQAFRFEKEARTLKRAMIWKRVRLYLVISFVVAVLVVIAAMLACGASASRGAPARASSRSGREGRWTVAVAEQGRPACLSPLAWR